MSIASQQKRSGRDVPVEVKLKAIQRVADGETNASVARIFHVPESTLRGWCRNKGKLQALANISSPSLRTDRHDGIPKAKRAKLELQFPQSLPNNGAVSEANYSSSFLMDLQALPGEINEPLSLVTRRSTFDTAHNNVKEETNRNLVETLKTGNINESVMLAKQRSILKAVNQSQVYGRKERNPACPCLPSGEHKSAAVIDSNNFSFIKWYRSRSGDIYKPLAIDPPENAGEALKHAKRFYKYLEQSSDYKVSAAQLNQFRHLINSVRSSAERYDNKASEAKMVKNKFL